MGLFNEITKKNENSEQCLSQKISKKTEINSVQNLEKKISFEKQQEIEAINKTDNAGLETAIDLLNDEREKAKRWMIKMLGNNIADPESRKTIARQAIKKFPYWQKMAENHAVELLATLSFNAEASGIANNVIASILERYISNDEKIEN